MKCTLIVEFISKYKLPYHLALTLKGKFQKGMWERSKDKNDKRRWKFSKGYLKYNNEKGKDNNIKVNNVPFHIYVAK
jgi:hypothetical protein